MGIRFHCPNGHKLNVKTFLAGKRGYCPKCKIKLVIPLESEAEFEDKDGSGPAVELATEQPAGAVNDPLATATATTTAASSDPKANGRTENQWYLCPPSGGQYGPVGMSTMQQWITEGRVTVDSLVWRTGWADWQTANDVFDQLPTSKTAQQELPGEGVPELMESSSPATSRRRRSERTTMTAVVLLLLAALLLGGALYLALKWT